MKDAFEKNCVRGNEKNKWGRDRGELKLIRLNGIPNRKWNVEYSSLSKEMKIRVKEIERKREKSIKYKTHCSMTYGELSNCKMATADQITSK